MSENPHHVLMCAPKHFGVQYVINPWMEGNVGRARKNVAVEQWDKLHKLVSDHASVSLIDPGADLPDMPFTANYGLVSGESFIPSRFRFSQRDPEIPRACKWFRAHDYDVVELQDPGSFEGEGDALFQPGERLLWGGYGVRTSLQVYRRLARLLHVEVIPVRLVDERFYHLDTCFCPLPDGRVLYYPKAFDQESVDLIRRRVPSERRIEVSDEDALNFACNAVIVGNAFIANHASIALHRALTAWGYSVITTPLTEFMLAGGAAKCLVLHLQHNIAAAPVPGTPIDHVSDRVIEVQGQLLDTGLMNELLDRVAEGGGSFEVEEFRAGIRRDQESQARVRVVAPTPARLNDILVNLIQMGARVIDEERDATLQSCVHDGVAPREFYSTTIYPTEVRVNGQWRSVDKQRMDAVVVVRGDAARCVLMRDLRQGDPVVCGVNGIRTYARPPAKSSGGFEFMASGVSSERRVELVVEDVAWEMRRIRERGGKIVVVAGPVVIHTGGGQYLAKLVRDGYVQVLLGGNAIAVHDLEENRFGTSLGVDLKRGAIVQGGHRHHLRVINRVRECGGIAECVRQGIVTSGIFFECIKKDVPFCLAGSIRDDGPLPETIMDLIAAQTEYARLIEGADLILMLATTLHAIGVGNMTPAGVRLICVDISPAAVTKLADRGSLESTGVVTDVGLFLSLLSRELEAHELP